MTGLSRSRGVRIDGAADEPGRGPNGRIVGGRLVTEDDAVFGGGFYTKLFFRNNATSYFFYCGGSLIGSDKVLTAAHCVEGDPSAALGDVVRIGGRRLVEGFQRTITKVVLHPDYDPATANNDLAILTFADPPTSAEYRAAGVEVAFINSFSRFPRAGRTLAVAGHGRVSGTGNEISPALRVAAVPINAWAQCNGWWRKQRLDEFVVDAASQPLQVCGGLGTRDATCGGDSGGPLFERRVAGGRAFTRLYGVVSYGISNGNDDCPVINPDYYASTSGARAFIRANT